MAKNSNRDQVQFDGSWLAIIICLFALPPIGIFLLWRKLSKTSVRSKDVRQYKGIASGASVIGLIIMLLGRGTIGLWLALGGAGVLAAGKWLDMRERRYRKYLAVIGDRPFMSIRSLAASIPVPLDQARRDLQDMIDKHYFDAPAYIDMYTMDLVLNNAAYMKHESAAGRAATGEQAKSEPESRQAPAREQQARPEAAAPRAASKGAPFKEAQFSDFIRQLREVNERIEDEVISEKIDRIERITANIFGVVEKRPEMMPKIRTFMSYYLPTTLKLLDSYALLELQGVSGENIAASKQQIEAIMDTLIAGFEKQLDQLFKSQVMDISTDIEVLERMMAKDGLKENKYVLRQQGG